jgi:hypothetical protein
MKMSAIGIEWHDYVAALRNAIPDGLHLHGMTTIWSWIRDMLEAGEHALRYLRRHHGLSPGRYRTQKGFFPI